MSDSKDYNDFISSLVSRLTNEGYRVFVEPARELLPAFMGNYRPDVVAFADGKKNRAIEIKTIRSTAVLDKVANDISAIFAGQDDWHFEVVFVRPMQAPQLPRAGWEAVTEVIETADRLAATSDSRAAMLMYFAAFEAAGRNLLPIDMRRPQSPGRVLELLASGGEVSPAHADAIRRLVSARNAFIHGDLSASPSKSDLSQFSSALRSIVDLGKELPDS